MELTPTEKAIIILAKDKARKGLRVNLAEIKKELKLDESDTTFVVNNN